MQRAWLASKSRAVNPAPSSRPSSPNLSRPVLMSLQLPTVHDNSIITLTEPVAVVDNGFVGCRLGIFCWALGVESVGKSPNTDKPSWASILLRPLSRLESEPPSPRSDREISQCLKLSDYIILEHLARWKMCISPRHYVLCANYLGDPPAIQRSIVSTGDRARTSQTLINHAGLRNSAERATIIHISFTLYILRGSVLLEVFYPFLFLRAFGEHDESERPVFQLEAISRLAVLRLRRLAHIPQRHLFADL